MLESIFLLGRAAIGLIVVALPLVMFALICGVPVYILLYTLFFI